MSTTSFILPRSSLKTHFSPSPFPALVSRQYSGVRYASTLPAMEVEQCTMWLMCFRWGLIDVYSAGMEF